MPVEIDAVAVVRGRPVAPTREDMGRAVFAGSASSRRWSRPCSDPEEPPEHQMSAHLS
ncbi:MAG: hypothetical protein AB7J32_21230 [Pseudonocardia sp.]